jgi:RHS repeat-associated protein
LYQTDSVSGLPTKHVQLNGRDIALITGPTGSSNIAYSFPDNQNSTNVVTDSTSNIQQTLDYYPYGSTRINSGSDVSARKYIGQFADTSGLAYLNARYLAPSQGQFVSQDATFLAIGNSGQLKQLTQQDQNQFLMDPQQMNSPRTTGGSNLASASGWNGNTQSRGNSMFTWAEYLADPQQQNSYSDARERMRERVCRIMDFAGKRQFLLDVIDSIIFDDDVLYIRGFVPVAIQNSAEERTRRSPDPMRCPIGE